MHEHTALAECGDWARLLADYLEQHSLEGVSARPSAAAPLANKHETAPTHTRRSASVTPERPML